MFMELIWIITFLLFKNTLKYQYCSYFDMADLDLTYINQNVIDYTLRQSEIKFSPSYNSMEKLII